jgi:hypothetical protein
MISQLGFSDEVKTAIWPASVPILDGWRELNGSPYAVVQESIAHDDSSARAQHHAHIFPRPLLLKAFSKLPSTSHILSVK